MFYGEYTHGIDNKGRLILPARLREVAKENGVEKFFVTRGLDKCIFMFAEGEWRLQEARFKNLSFTKGEARSFNRMFFSGAVEVLPDKQGRFIIPQYLKDFAGIKKDAVVIDYGYAKKGADMVGDVDFESVSKKALWITPVPGGMGPLVIAAVLQNLIALTQERPLVSQ